MSLEAERRYLPRVNRDPTRVPSLLSVAFQRAEKGDLRWPLYVHGEPGTGKTCAALCLVDFVQHAEFWPFDEFCAFVIDVKFDRAERMEPGRPIEGGGRELPKRVRYRQAKFWPWVEGLPLVVIDDLGLRGRASDTQYEAMKLLLDRRTELPLVVTSNHPLEKIAEIFDARVFDRLAAGTVLELKGQSMR